MSTKQWLREGKAPLLAYLGKFQPRARPGKRAGPEVFVVGGPSLPPHHLTTLGRRAGHPTVWQSCTGTPILWVWAPSTSPIPRCPLGLCSGEQRHLPEPGLKDVCRLHRFFSFQLTLLLLGY